jgi:tetratricopeptide (TPR) repeat protein
MTRRFLWALLICCAILVQGATNINEDDNDDDVTQSNDGNNEFANHNDEQHVEHEFNSELVGSDQHDDGPPIGGLSCRHVQDTMVCEFAISKDELSQHAFTVCEDKMCVEAVIRAFPDPAATTESSIHVETQTYEPPFSQYGPAIEAALNAKPADLKSASYPYWIVNSLGMAHRGDGTSDEQLEVAIQVMSTAKGYYEQYYERHPTEYIYAQLGIASSFIAIGESHSLLGRNAEAKAHYESARSIYETLLTRTDLRQETRDSIQLFLADALVRLGVLAVDKTMMEVGGYGMLPESMLPLIHSSETMLSQAVDIYRSAVERGGPDLRQTQLQLADALQDFGSTLIMSKGDMTQVLDIQREALVMYRELMHAVDNMKTLLGVDRYSIVTSMAQLLLNMADSALQAGKYTECTQYYNEAMDWYKKHNLPGPGAFKMTILEDDEVLLQYEMALADYQATASTELEADAIYEADLHATLGALKLARDDLTIGYSHILKSIDMYELYGEEHLAAAAYLNLAMGLFREGKFAESSDAHQRGVDTYQRVFGEGNNPFMAGLTDMLTDAGIDIGQLTLDLKTPETAKVNINADQAGVVSERLIDLDALQQSQRNATVKEEL